MIKRYDYDEDAVWENMKECSYGDWVKYDDHMAVMQKLEERVSQLEAGVRELEKEVLRAYDIGMEDGKRVGSIL